MCPCKIHGRHPRGKILSMTFHARHGQDENLSGMMTPSDDEGHGIFMTWSM